eukprot:s1195_g5.t1
MEESLSDTLHSSSQTARCAWSKSSPTRKELGLSVSAMGGEMENMEGSLSPGFDHDEVVPRERRNSNEVKGDESMNSLETRKQAILRNLQQYYDANFTSTMSLGKHPQRERRRCIFPKSFTVPASVVKRAMEILDQSESPDCPGEMRLGEVIGALHRFHSALGEEKSLDWDLQILEDLGLSTDVSAFDPEMMIEWHTESVYSRFRVELGTLERLYFALDMGDNSSLLSKAITGSLLVAVFLSMICWIVGTTKVFRVLPCMGEEVNSCTPREPAWMETVEMVCVWVFTAEILLRLICVAQTRSELLNQRYLIDVITEQIEWNAPRSGARRFLAFLFSIQAICDVLSVIPFWVELILQPTQGTSVAELSLLRVLYITRVVRLFKLTRALNADLGQFNEINDLFKKVLANAAPAILMTVLLIVIALFFFGTFIWFCERGEWVGKDSPRYQALVIGDRGSEAGAWLRVAADGLTEELSPFTSIPGAFWWTIVTITTVGYGDQVPTSWVGKTVGSVAMLYGTVILGLPLFVVGATFGQEYNRLMKDAKRREELKSDRSAGKHGTSLRHAERTARFAKATGNFIEEHDILRVAMKEYCPLLGIPEGVVCNWEEGLRAALLEQSPATGMDRLMIRVLHYLAEVEEYWMLKASKPRAAPSPAEEDSRSCRHQDRSHDLSPVDISPKGLSSPDSKSSRYPDRGTDPTIVVRLSKCRRLRTMWYRLAITGCQLGMVPSEVLAKALSDCGGFCSGKTRKRLDSRDSRGSASPTLRLETSPASIQHGEWRVLVLAVREEDVLVVKQR